MKKLLLAAALLVLPPIFLAPAAAAAPWSPGMNLKNSNDVVLGPLVTIRENDLVYMALDVANDGSVWVHLQYYWENAGWRIYESDAIFACRDYACADCPYLWPTNQWLGSQVVQEFQGTLYKATIQPVEMSDLRAIKQSDNSCQYLGDGVNPVTQEVYLNPVAVGTVSQLNLTNTVTVVPH
jgi:hypothetical protein